MKIAINPEKAEFETHAKALFMLREALGESYIVSAEHSYRKCRFDIAIFEAKNRTCVCTVEIKRKGGIRKHGKQLNRYFWATGKPCVLLTEATLVPAILALKSKLSQKAARAA